MATVAFRLFGSLELQTAQLEQRLTAAGNAIERFNRPQVIATRAVAQFRSSLQSLAIGAIGATGPIGVLGSSLLTLAGGTTGLAVLAGVAGMVALLRSMGTEARESAVRIGDLQKQWEGMMRAAGPNVATIQQLAGVGAQPGLIEQRRLLEGQLVTARAGVVQREGMGQPPTLLIDAAKIARLETELGKVNVNIALLTTTLGEQRLSLLEGSLTGVGAQLAADVAAAVRGIDFSQIPSPTFSLVQQGLPLPDMTGAIELVPAGDRLTPFLDIIGNAGVRIRDFSDASLEAAARMQRVGAQSVQTAHMIGSAGNVIAALIAGGGGGGGGVLSGLGGLAGLAGGLKNTAGLALLGGAASPLMIGGAIASALGGIWSAFENRRETNEERRHREMLQAMHERPPVFIYSDDVSDSGMARQSVRWNRYISRGGKGPTGPTRSGQGLSRP